MLIDPKTEMNENFGIKQPKPELEKRTRKVAISKMHQRQDKKYPKGKMLLNYQGALFSRG